MQPKQSYWPAPDNTVILTADLLTSGSMHADGCHGYQYGVDSSSHFPSTAQTDRQTDKVTNVHDHTTHSLAITGVG